MRALLLVVLLSAAAPARAASEIGFDRRVELLGVLERLARPVPGDASPYAEAARRRFAPFAAHPAVASLRAVPEGGRAELTEAFLGHGTASFLKEAEEFGRAADFDGFWKETAGLRAGLEKAARAEAARGLPPEAVASYLRVTDGPHRFVLAPLLPRAMAANRPRLRVRTPAPGKKAPWELSEFGSDAGHEAAHDLLDPFAESSAAAIDGGSDRMFAGCTSDWRGCVMEEVVVAVTLRALARSRGEKAAEPLATEYSGKYRDVPALCARLREWEGARGGEFAAFYPRLLETVSGSSRAAAPAPPRRRPRP